MSDLAHRLESLAAATELARGRLEEEWIEGVEAVLTRSRARITHGTDSTVVALAGATGAGKSTLFNAVAGSLISPSSVRRPTTGAVHAAVWAAEEQTTGLLDWLEASKRHFITTPSPELEGLVLLDLPDFDSTTRENRMLVDRLIELVDALVWVTDPQKYADELFHENYVRPLAGYADVMVFLLNQIDLLEATAQENCRKDLIRLLQADGVPKPEVLGVSATVGTGLDQVRNVLADVVRKREVVLARMATDLKEVAKDVPVAGATSRRLVSKRTEAGLVAALASAAGGDHVTKAAAAGYRLDAAGATGWPVTRWLRRFRAHPLRRLHLGGEGRTSLPGARPVAEAEATLAVRRTVDAAKWALLLSRKM